LIKLANQRICADLGDKFRSCRNYLSVGISKYKDNGMTLNELINAADSAMYEAKREKSLYKFCYKKD
jgi:PleD family two-component response regulator